MPRRQASLVLVLLLAPLLVAAPPARARAVEGHHGAASADAHVGTARRRRLQGAARRRPAGELHDGAAVRRGRERRTEVCRRRALPLQRRGLFRARNDHRGGQRAALPRLSRREILQAARYEVDLRDQPVADPKNRAAGYTLRDGQLMNIRRVWQMELASHYGVMSTVKDLVAWDAALAAGRVLAPATLAEMWTPVRLNYGGTYPYGFGWFVDDRRGHPWISHAGIPGTAL